MKRFFLTLIVLLSVAAIQAHAASIQKTMASINADAQKPGGPERVLKSISASTGVPVATLEKQKAKTGMNYGDIFVAHSIAKASGKSFDDIAGMKKKGQTWEKIAEANNVSLGGQKTVAANGPKASPTPEMKTQSQLQRERWSQSHPITNAPKKP